MTAVVYDRFNRHMVEDGAGGWTELVETNPVHSPAPANESDTCLLALYCSTHDDGHGWHYEWVRAKTATHGGLGARVADERVKEEDETRQRAAASWSFTPEITVESLPQAERAAVADMYASVDVTAASASKEALECEFLPVASLLPASAPTSMIAGLRRSWLKQHYVKVVSRVLHTLAECG